MKTTPRRGSWRNVAPGQYVKNIGTYGDVKFGATARVSFIPFPTCEILDANGVHVAIPSPVDSKKFIASAKKVYTKDTKAEAERVRSRAAAKTKPVPTHTKWKPPSQNMYGLTTISDDPYRSLPPQEEWSTEQKLAKTDEKRRTRAHNIWLSGKEPGTPRDIYLRLYAADAKKYRK
jgi:hypothetical protein